MSLALRAERALVAPLSGAREVLASWLLGDSIQVTEGTERGGVVGWLDSHGRADFVYPEITGYYLQWLAWHASRHGIDALTARRAGAAQEWLGTWLARPNALATRTYLRGTPDDWRNHAIFCFDLAMALRGLGAAARLRLIEPDREVVTRLCAELGRMEDHDGLFRACVPHEPTALLPVRWSTRRGGFLTKAASAIIGASVYLPGVPRELVAAAERTYDAALDWMHDAPHEEVHPLLYAMEGVLMQPRHRRFGEVVERVATQFAALLELAEGLGRVPEMRSEPGVGRLDIVAQTVRVGILLEIHVPHRATARPSIATLLAHLSGHVVHQRGVPFDPHAARPQYNLWTSMFAEQALAIAHSRPDAHILADSEPLLV
jgi:hypothetical protein